MSNYCKYFYQDFLNEYICSLKSKIIKVVQPNFDHLRQSAKISMGLLVCLFILSIVLYKLRMYFLDAPFIVFQIIKDDSPAIMVGRYGAIITQIFPFVGQKLGLPMAAILVLYSMSFNLFYLFAGMILYKLKAYHWVIILAFYQIGFATEAFFWTNNEVHQGICYLSLSAGIWYYAHSEIRSNAWLLYILAAAILFVSIITHPLIIPVVVFVLGCMFLFKELSIRRNRDLALVVFSILACVFKYFLSKSNWYDGDKLNQLSGQSLSSWASVLDKPAAKLFLPELFFNHWSALVVILLSVFILLRRKLYLILAWMLGFSIIYLLAISMIIFDYTKFYTESQWMVVAIFIVLPLLYQVKNISNSIIFRITIFVFVLWIFNMVRPYQSFKDRYDWQTSILDKMEIRGIDKLILSDISSETIDTLKMSWGLPIESLMISVAERKKPMTMLVNQPEREKGERKVFLSCFEEIAIQNLNKNYFPLDTSTEYTVVKYDSF